METRTLAEIHAALNDLATLRIENMAKATRTKSRAVFLACKANAVELQRQADALVVAYQALKAAA